LKAGGKSEPIKLQQAGASETATFHFHNMYKVIELQISKHDESHNGNMTFVTLMLFQSTSYSRHRLHTDAYFTPRLKEISMRKSIILAASLASMLVSSAAFAASMSDAGAIKAIDAKANTITLADGKVFILPAKFDLKTIKVGEKVTVTYDMKGKDMIATLVKAG
jgi:Protein of unknown function (DUF1344)